MLKVGITGGIGSGKSLVASIFRVLGVPVFDADTWAKKIMVSDGDLVQKIKTTCGNEAYTTDGKINRPYLAQYVFNSLENQQKINAIVHPAVQKHFAAWVSTHSTYPYLLKESALLLNPDVASQVGEYLVVTSPLALLIKRLLQRDAHRTKQDVEKIVTLQMPEADLLKKATYIIKNDDVEMILPQVLQLHLKLSDR